MPENFQQAIIARSIALSAGVNVLDADIAKTNADPGEALGPILRVGSGPVRWAVEPAASTADDAAPIDGLGLLVDAVMVRVKLDADGVLVGYDRDPSTAENNGGTLTGHQHTITDTSASRGDLVYLTLLSYDNVGSIAACRIVAISGLSILQGEPT